MGLPKMERCVDPCRSEAPPSIVPPILESAKAYPSSGGVFDPSALGKFSALFRSAKAGVVGMPRLTFARHAAIRRDYASAVGVGSGSDWSVSFRGRLNICRRSLRLTLPPEQPRSLVCDPDQDVCQHRTML